MSPDACLRAIGESDDERDRFHRCADLRDWIRRGGCAPVWSECPVGTVRYREWLFVHGDKRDRVLMENSSEVKA